MSRGRILLCVAVILLGIGVRVWLLWERLTVNDEAFPMTLGSEYDSIVTTIAAIEPLHERSIRFSRETGWNTSPKAGSCLYITFMQNNTIHCISIFQRSTSSRWVNLMKLSSNSFTEQLSSWATFSEFPFRNLIRWKWERFLSRHNECERASVRF